MFSERQALKVLAVKLVVFVAQLLLIAKLKEKVTFNQHTRIHVQLIGKLMHGN